MTRRSILEYAEAVRERYFRGTNKKKAEMLNEFVATTGLHRKAAIRLLNRRSRLSVRKRRGRPRLYGVAMIAALHGYLIVRLGQLPVIRCGERRLVVPLAALQKMLRGEGQTTKQEQEQPQTGGPSLPYLSNV